MYIFLYILSLLSKKISYQNELLQYIKASNTFYRVYFSHISSVNVSLCFYQCKHFVKQLYNKACQNYLGILKHSQRVIFCHFLAFSLTVYSNVSDQETQKEHYIQRESKKNRIYTRGTMPTLSIESNTFPILLHITNHTK